MCLFPRLIRNAKYTANKKNGGVIPAVYDTRALYVPKICGNCIECRKQKARDWSIRLTEENRDKTNGKFVTFTFRNDTIRKLSEDIKLTGYDLDNAICSKAVRLFTENWRKKYGKTIRHWLITELGHKGTENVHLHGIVWTDESIEKINDKWIYGYMYPRTTEDIKKNYVGDKTIQYITKYVTKIDKIHSQYKPAIFSSKGLGKNYTDSIRALGNRYKGEDTDQTYRTTTGHKINLPKYYKNKLYSDDQKEKLWLNLLDKEERFIMGEKIDISNGEEDYYKTLEHYQKHNNKLGYGNDNLKNNWNKRAYENERRIMMQRIRIKNDQKTQKYIKDILNKLNIITDDINWIYNTKKVEGIITKKN